MYEPKFCDSVVEVTINFAYSSLNKGKSQEVRSIHTEKAKKHS